MALLFFASGSFTLPADQQIKARQLLAGDPSFGPLIQAIEKRIAADPTAVADGDPDITAAIQAALTSMGAPSRSPLPAPALPAGSAANRRAVIAASSRVSRADIPTLMLVQPSAPQSGLILQQSDDQTGLQITNTFRRECFYFIRETGFKDAAGNSVAKTADIATGKSTESVPSVNRLNGAIGSVIDVLRGLGAYQPVNVGPIHLPLDPPDAQETVYHVTVVGPGLDPGHPPKFGDQPISDRANIAAGVSLVKEIILPLVFAVIDRHLDLSHLQNQGPLFEKTFRNLVSLGAVGGHVGLSLSGTHFDPQEFTVVLFRTIVDDPVFRQAFVQFLNTTLSDLAFATGQQIGLATAEGILTRLNLVLGIIDKGFALGDAAKVAVDWGQSHFFDEWDVTVTKPSVHLSPATATVDVNNNIVSLTASVSGQKTGDLRFVWTTPGTQGHLESANSSTPLGTGPIPDAKAVYVADLLKLRTGQSDTVTVQAFVASDLSTPIGSATATIATKTDLGCGALPKQLGPNGSVPPTLTLDKTDYHAGDTMTVTIGIPGVNGLQTWVVDMLNNDARKPAIVDVLTVDGQAPPVGSVIINSAGVEVRGPTNLQGTAKSHAASPSG